MEDLHRYRISFSENGMAILESARDEMRRRHQNVIIPEHIFYALIEKGADLFNSTMHNLSIDPNIIRLKVEKRLANCSAETIKGFRIAVETTELFKFSKDKARSQSRRIIEPGDIIYALTNDDAMALSSKSSLLKDILGFGSKVENLKRF